MKVICVAQCFHKGRTYLPGQQVKVSDLTLIPPQHFSTVAGEPLVTRDISKKKDNPRLVEGQKKIEWLVDPKTGKPYDGDGEGAEEKATTLTVKQIKEKLDELKCLYDSKLERAELLALLEEAQADALSE